MTPDWLRRPVFLYTAAALVQVALAALFNHAWDGFVFETTVRSFVTEGVTPYQTMDERPPYAYNCASVDCEAEWYAYPPLPLLLMSGPYALFASLGLPWAWLGRLAWKLPIIAASLLLPRIGRETALGLGARPEAARRVELLLLLNPLVWYTGAVKGMTEPILLAFLLGSLWAHARGRLGLSGALWGLAASVKLFPLFLYPALLGFLWLDRRRWAPVLRHAAAAGATFGAIALPFAAAHWRGFLDLVLLLHLRRRAQGFSLFVPIQEGVRQAFGSTEAAAVVGLLGLAMLAAWALLALGWLEGGRRPLQSLPWALGALLALFLLSNKVLNSQYFLMPAALFILAAAFSHPFQTELGVFARRFCVVVTVALLFDALKFLTFLPLDISQRLWGTDAATVRDSVPLAFGLQPLWVYYVTTPLAVSVMIWSAAPLRRPLAAFLRECWHGLHRAGQQISEKHLERRLSRPALTVAFVLLLLVPGGVSLLLQNSTTEARPPGMPDVGPRVAGVYYYLWWSNPSFDPERREGNWRWATTQPLAGYYSSYKGQIELDVHAMRSAGFDFALVPVHSYDANALETLSVFGQAEGLRVAPLLDLATGPRWVARTPAPPAATQPYALVPTDINDLRDYVRLVGRSLYESPAMLQLEPGRPTVFIEGARWLGDPTDPDEEARIIDRLQEDQPAALLTRAVGNQTWMRHPELLSPSRAAHAAEPQTLQALWEATRDRLFREAWNEILQPLAEREPPVSIVLAEADVGTPGFPHELVAQTYRTWAQRPPTAGPLVAESGAVATLWPAYDARLLRPEDAAFPVTLADGSVRLTTQWRSLNQSRLSLVHSWNNHFDGTAIEPTVEYGHALATISREEARAWHARPFASVN